MAYIRALGQEETTGSPVALEVLDRLELQAKEILDGQKRAERRWRYQTAAAIAGAIFAAVRLGIIAVPHIRQRRIGTLGLVPNPRRRRRRRRK